MLSDSLPSADRTLLQAETPNRNPKPKTLNCVIHVGPYSQLSGQKVQKFGIDMSNSGPTESGFEF